MRYYDPQRRALVYVEQEASPEFWDAHWSMTPDIREEILNSRDHLVTRTTQRFLKAEDGPVLEGGCGLGQHVASLKNAGFEVVGVDLALDTVEKLNNLLPELDIRQADICDLPFPEGHFGGCWSLGVIEHFWEGFEPIAREMSRVLKDGGYAFVTFPFMSAMRRFNARLGRYPRWEGETCEGFYQFALDPETVKQSFESVGFKVVLEEPLKGLKGIKHEVPEPLSMGFRWLHGYKGKEYSDAGNA